MLKFFHHFSYRKVLYGSFILFILLGLGSSIYLAQKSQDLGGKAQEIQTEQEFSQSFPLNSDKPIYSFSVDGKLSFNSKKSLFRVILIDNQQNEYLAYETYPLLADDSSFSFNNACEETCLLDAIVPVSYKIESYKTTHEIAKTSLSDNAASLNQEVNTSNITDQQKTRKEEREKAQVEKINKQIKKRGAQWIAGETSVSKMSYAQKKKFFGNSKSTLGVPNLQGIEYYKGGVFEVVSDEPIITTNFQASELPERVDYRNLHGGNWITPVRNQSICGSCWAFAALATTEAHINLYYNQQIEADLAEQDLVCRYPESCTHGGSVISAFEDLRFGGVTEEFCYPYTADGNCPEKCPEWDLNLWKIEFYRAVEMDDESLKRGLIERGPLTFGIPSWNHVMNLVGYEKAYTGQTIWKLKNSWGTGWGEGGFGNLIVPQEDRYLTLYPERPYFSHDQSRYQINCVDRDHDNYCQWGVSSQKPGNCPGNCFAEKDCDDTNPQLGPYDTTLNCLSTAAIPSATPTPCANPPPPTLYSPRDGANFPVGSSLDYFIIPISNKCGGSNPEYQINFLFRGKSYSGSWNGTSWLSTGPYNFPGIVTWKAKTRYYDSFYRTYKESPWSAPWAYNIISATPTPTRFPSLTPTPTRRPSPTPTLAPSSISWAITAEIACDGGMNLTQREKTQLFWALWPPNPLTWRTDYFAMGSHRQTVAAPYSRNGVYLGLESENGTVLHPFAVYPPASIRFEAFFNPPTWMAMWYGNSLGAGSYTIIFRAPDSWCVY